MSDTTTGITGVLIKAVEYAFFAVVIRIGWEFGGILFHLLHH